MRETNVLVARGVCVCVTTHSINCGFGDVHGYGVSCYCVLWGKKETGVSGIF